MAEHAHSTPETKSCRRALLRGLVAAPVVLGPALAAQAASSDLSALIAAHRTARGAFNEAIEQREAIEAAYDEAFDDDGIIVPSLLGGGYSLKNGDHWCREQMRISYENQRRALQPLLRMAPDIGNKALAAIEAKEAENIAIMDRVFDEVKARQEKFGIAAVDREYEDAASAEDVAIFAICAYRPRTIDEAAIKAGYLLELRQELDEEHIEALLRSFIGGANV
jgi:hypothetical protein